ncbi:hypothetical protein C8Q74DRAFT_638069 [Fomes fomentarius]|nr:hypothetical protein C8Q74DRAFT_638069 [Fomes fomentarius]
MESGTKGLCGRSWGHGARCGYPRACCVRPNISIRTESETKGQTLLRARSQGGASSRRRVCDGTGAHLGVRPRRMVGRVGRGVVTAVRAAERAVGEDAHGRGGMRRGRHATGGGDRERAEGKWTVYDCEKGTGGALCWMSVGGAAGRGREGEGERARWVRVLLWLRFSPNDFTHVRRSSPLGNAHSHRRPNHPPAAPRASAIYPRPEHNHQRRPASVDATASGPGSVSPL